MVRRRIELLWFQASQISSDAGGQSRTDMGLIPVDFESTASTISPHPHLRAHFNCGVFTSFATRPYLQLHYYNPFFVFATTSFHILCCLPIGRFLALVALELDELTGLCGQL